MAARAPAASVRPMALTVRHPAAGAEERPAEAFEPTEQIELLMRDLRSSPQGLSQAEAQRRLVQFGPNVLRRRGGPQWPAELVRQLTHPLALLLWLAAALSLAAGNRTVAVAVVMVIAINALFALLQEMQAERAVEALALFLPQRVRAMREGTVREIPAAELVPGDVVLIEEGDRIAADMRLISGAVEVDLSTLNGESAPALRSAAPTDASVPRIEARDLLFSGTSATGGEARGVVFATGMRTELGRIAALSERVKEEPSPLESQVRKVAWLIAAIAIAMAVAFVPLAIVGAGLSLKNSVVFAVGLLAGNVPEGLLPVITLALAVAVRRLARRGALVKRLSAVETLGSTDVICTDKTGTLTENRMSPVAAWTLGGEVSLESDRPGRGSDALRALAAVARACNNATLDPHGESTGDPTEVALLKTAEILDAGAAARGDSRRHLYSFDPQRKLMSTLNAGVPCDWLATKGAPEAVLPRCTTATGAEGREAELTPAMRERVREAVEAFAERGLRVLALARRELASAVEPPERDAAERELCFLGLVAMQDPPRAEVVEAVARCHAAGIRIVIITGDHPLTAAAVARQVGIGAADPLLVNAQAFDHRHEQEVRDVLATGREAIFARASPETKLQIAEALRGEGHVVAMTGDGVNDAPALRTADIGVAMGRSGTDVAREASTMVLTDDNFATIVVAIEAGRQVYDNVRKFIQYIFAHATPEVVPFILFAFAGGAIPLPLTVMLILAFDVGTETLPSLALGREPIEPGTMQRPPRSRSEGVIQGPMLVRAWLFLGGMVSALSLAGFFFVLTRAGWHAGDPVGAGHRLHHAYLEATTMTFAGMIAGQIGTAFAVRTRRASLRSVGFFSNPYLLLGIAGELALAGVFIYAPPLQSLLGTAALSLRDVAFLAPFPVIVWGADELRRWVLRRCAAVSVGARAPAAR
jgi:calcium-translocating P-type ATPase